MIRMIINKPAQICNDRKDQNYWYGQQPIKQYIMVGMIRDTCDKYNDRYDQDDCSSIEWQRAKLIGMINDKTDVIYIDQ